MHVQDYILAETGGPTINEGLLSYYQTGGAVSGILQEAEREFLIAAGVLGRGHTQEMWHEYWDTLSIPAGTYVDRWLWFWGGWATGGNLFTNGDFSDGDSGWHFSDPAAYVENGHLVVDGSQAAGFTPAQNIGIVNGQTYLIQFDVLEYTAGWLSGRVGAVNGAAISYAGAYREVITAGASTYAGFQFDGDTNCILDNVSIRTFTPSPA